jgi:hypothetical protein
LVLFSSGAMLSVPSPAGVMMLPYYR